MKYIEQTLQDVTVVQEPVDDWFAVKDHHNVSLFQHFYEEPNKYSFLFQMNIMASRYRTMMSSNHNKDQVSLYERSIMTDKHVFVSTLYDMNQLNDMEFEVFNNMYGCMEQCTKKIDGIIYLQCSPEVSYERIKKRNRDGEINGITKEYLQALHHKHEEWLTNYKDVPVYTLNVTNDDVDYSQANPFILQKN